MGSEMCIRDRMVFDAFTGGVGNSDSSGLGSTGGVTHGGDP